MAHKPKHDSHLLSPTKTLLTGAAIVAGGAAIAALAKEENRKKLQKAMRKVYVAGEQVMNKTYELSEKYMDDHEEQINKKVKAAKGTAKRTVRELKKGGD